jgi:hypothetical protein
MSKQQQQQQRQMWNRQQPQQPTSLPPDLIAASQQDLERLAGLRRTAESDYRRLESARIESVQNAAVSSGSVSLDASFRFHNSGPESTVVSEQNANGTDSSCPSSSSSSSNTASHASNALFSLARAYKVKTLVPVP